MNIKSGMLIEFNYLDKDNNKSMPLVFVVDTDEYTTRDKKVFHGINLNYMPYTEVEKFFVSMNHEIRNAGLGLYRPGNDKQIFFIFMTC